MKLLPLGGSRTWTCIEESGTSLSKVSLVKENLKTPLKKRCASLDMMISSLKTHMKCLSRVQACHRLKQEKNAGIIIRFNNLTDRNLSLQNAKNQKNSDKSITIPPDIPPILKPLKKELLDARKELPNKSTAKLRYSKSWPYISLKI
jgi:hypothetical protein